MYLIAMIFLIFLGGVTATGLNMLNGLNRRSVLPKQAPSMGERQLLSDDKYIYMCIAALSLEGFTVRFLTIFLFAALKRRRFKGFLVYLRYATQNFYYGKTQLVL